MAGYSATGGGVGLLASAASTVVSSPGVSGGPASAAAAAPSASAAVWAQAGMDTAAGGGSTGKFANYKIISTIGRGNFGVCHLCECIDTNSPQYLGKQFVIKQINMSQLSVTEKEGAVQEVKLLSELHHPFIVGYRESFLEGEILNIVMNYCEGGDLTTLIKSQAASNTYFPEEQILDWFIQLCLALRYIHQRRIIHRDLKSQNVFLTKKKNIRLGDFGIARVLNGTNELAMSVVGTPYSMSPEVCENKPYSFKSDIWAAGCVLYELCTLKHAFDAHNLLGLVWKIVSENYPPIPEHYSKDLKDLVGAMLAKDPQQRPSIDMILELQFIRARLHSQIKAKMTLKTNKAGGAAATTAGQASTGNSPTKPTTARTVAQTTRPATTSAAGTVASSPSNIAASSTLPSQQPSAAAVRTPSASVSSSGVQQGAGPSTSPTPHSGPNGTMRAPRPTLDVGDRNHSPQGSPTPTASNVAVGASNGQRSFSANRNGASTPSANNNPLASPSAVGSSRTSSASSSAYPSPHDASGHAAAPLMSPSEQLLQRKQALADQRQAELVAFQTSQVRGMSGSSASQSRAGEYRGGTSGRPGTSQPQQLPSYQAAFNDEPAQPARQRSAGATRTQQQGGYSGNDGSYSGRGVGTPTKPGADYYSYPAVPNTPSGGGGGNDDRPIKSSGSYFRPASGTGGGAPIMSPTAMQQARAANMAHSSSPPSSNNARGGSNNGRYGFSREDIDSELHLQDFDRPSSGSHHSHSHSGAAAASVRPTSVSSSRVTRVREEDDDDDAHSSGLGPLRGEDESYSDDDFENYEGDEEDAAIAVLEKTYTSHHLSRSPFEGGVSGSASSFASSSNAGGQVSGSYHGSTASTNTSFGTSASGFSSSASSASSQARSGPSSAGGARPISGSGSQQQGASSAPSMGSKQEAIKAMCLRSMSSSEFDEVCAFIRSRSSPSKGSGSGLSKEELASKFGSINQKVIFMVEQYVFLSEILEQHGSGATGTGSTANTSTAAGKKPQSQPNQQLQPSSSPVSSSRLNKPGSAGSSSAKPAASPSAGTTTAAKPTSAGSKKPAASPPPTSATSASAASKPKPPSSATTRTVVPPVAGAKKK